jgi:peptidoglycan/xylan/chitin deacetylase (PgdA/CDA1 family)
LYYHDPKPDVLDAHLDYLKRVARIVPLSKLWTSFSSGPLAVITIDDGHVGNLKLKEVFQKHNVRPTIYLVTGTICQDAGFWWLSVKPEQDIEQLKRVDNQTRKKLLYSLGFEETKKAIPRQTVPVDELSFLSDWADLGAHTRFHPILTRCTDQECQEEISGSRHDLLPLGIELNDFSYPNGDHSDREAEFVKAAGFNSARTTDPGWNGPQSDRFRLKAIYIDDEACVDKFAVQLTGVPGLARKFLRNIRGACLNKMSIALEKRNSMIPQTRSCDGGVAILEKPAAREGLSQAQPIAVMIGQLKPSGSERQLYIFLAHCDRTRWAPVVYVSGELGSLVTPINELGIPVVLLRGGRLAKMWQFRAACIAQGAKCFFSWSSYTNGFGLALTGLGVRRIGSLRNALFADLPESRRWLWSWMSLAGVSTLVCNSRETQAQAAERAGSRKHAVYVPNAVQVFTAEEIQAWREEWRARLGIARDEVLVLGAGRLTPQKNFARFVDAIAHVNHQLPVRAVIAGGDFGCMTEVQEQIARMGLKSTVQLIGEVPRGRELMCAADIFMLSSDHEGMPNVILEAMAAGVPCVASKVNSIYDLIQHGSTGFIADLDAADLARYVARLAADADLRSKLGAQARAAMEQSFQPHQVAPRLWALCDASS